MEPVTDVDDGRVIDQVEALDVQVEHLGVEKLLEMAGELVLIADGAVEGHHLVAVAPHQRGVVAHEQGCEHQRHEGGGQSDVGLHASDQAECQSGEEVGDLTLGQSGGAQADDRQDAEESQAQTGPQFLRAGQQERDGQDADVDSDISGHKVSATMTGYVKCTDQDGQRHHVKAGGGERGEGHRRIPFFAVCQGKTVR